MATWWCAKTGDKGEWISLDLEKEYDISAVQINFADQGVSKEKGGREYCTGYQYILEYSLDGETWQILVDRSENTKDMPHDYVQLEKETRLRYLKLTNLGEIPAGGVFLSFPQGDHRISANASAAPGGWTGSGWCVPR